MIIVAGVIKIQPSSYVKIEYTTWYIKHIFMYLYTNIWNK